MTTLAEMMTQEEMARCGVDRLTPAEREALFQWGLRVFGMGRHVCAEIEAIKYDGKLVVLNDGSRWEVDSIDTDTAAIWGELDKVVVLDGEMYNLEDCQKIEVSEDD